MRLYLGFPGWGWRMYGIGYKTLWFVGLSIQIESENKIKARDE